MDAVSSPYSRALCDAKVSVPTGDPEVLLNQIKFNSQTDHHDKEALADLSKRIESIRGDAFKTKGKIESVESQINTITRGQRTIEFRQSSIPVVKSIANAAGIGGTVAHALEGAGVGGTVVAAVAGAVSLPAAAVVVGVGLGLWICNAVATVSEDKEKKLDATKIIKIESDLELEKIVAEVPRNWKVEEEYEILRNNLIAQAEGESRTAIENLMALYRECHICKEIYRSVLEHAEEDFKKLEAQNADVPKIVKETGPIEFASDCAKELKNSTVKIKDYVVSFASTKQPEPGAEKNDEKEIAKS